MQPGSCSSPIQLANLKDHTTDSEGQYPINITLNKTSFHAEKTAHQQTHGPHISTAWLTVKTEHKQEHCGRSWICTLSSVLTTSTGTLAKKERGQAGEHGARAEGRSSFPSALLAILKTSLCSFVPSHSGFWMSFLKLLSTPVSQETAKEGPSLHDLCLKPKIIILLNQRHAAKRDIAGEKTQIALCYLLDTTRAPQGLVMSQCVRPAPEPPRALPTPSPTAPKTHGMPHPG